MSNLDDLRKLRARAEELADSLNLKIGGFAVTPGKDEHDNDILNVAFFLTAEAVETIEETEQRKIDDEFNALFGANFGDTTEFADDETKALLDKDEQQKQAAKEELQRLLDEMGET